MINDPDSIGEEIDIKIKKLNQTNHHWIFMNKFNRTTNR